MSTVLHVVIGIIQNDKKQVFIAQRLAHQEGGGLWEFPGGKVEPNETSYQALVREFKEEINIEITAADLWVNVNYDYPQRTVMLDVWMINKFLGKPEGAEGQPILWVGKDTLAQYEFPEANKLVIKKLLEIL